MKIILASSSPRRRELMKMFNLPFEVIVKDTEEILNKEKSVYEQCMDIAKSKALSVFNDTLDDVCVISGDTIVALDNVIYGKPKSREEALEMIKNFNNREHEVISAISVIMRKNNEVYETTTYDKCVVFVDKMSDKEIHDWVDHNDVLTRAGAYAIQDGFAKYIKKIEGDYFSIVGFPVHKLYEVLKKYDVL